MNSAGESTASNEVSAMPMTLPSAFVAFRAVSGNGYVELMWSAPINTGGLPIQSYRIYRNRTLFAEVSGGQLLYNDTSVLNGVLYSYHIQAVNSMGPGASTYTIHIRPLSTLRAPTSISAVA